MRTSGKKMNETNNNSSIKCYLNGIEKLFWWTARQNDFTLFLIYFLGGGFFKRALVFCKGMKKWQKWSTLSFSGQNMANFVQKLWSDLFILTVLNNYSSENWFNHFYVLSSCPHIKSDINGQQCHFLVKKCPFLTRNCLLDPKRIFLFEQYQKVTTSNIITSILMFF